MHCEVALLHHTSSVATMGNSGSKGTTLVTVSQDHYTTGDKVTGLVYLHLTRRIRTDVMWLKFSCEEQVQWQGPLGRMSSIKVNSLLRQKYPLGKWPEREVPPGSYAFPFEVQLPNDLPGSFRIEKPDLGAAIVYGLGAEIRGKKTVISHAIALVVHQSFAVPQDLTSNEETFNTSLSWWRHKGNTRLRISLIKDSFSTEESIQAVVSVDNSQGKVAVNGVKGTVLQTIRLRTSREQGGKSHKSSSQVTVFQSQLSVQPGQVIHDAPLIIDLPAGKKLPSSTLGRCIECKYSLVAELVLEGSGRCHGDETQVKVPVSLLAPGPARQELPPAPADWNPQLMPPSQFPISSEFDYQPSAPPLEDDDAQLG